MWRLDGLANFLPYAWLPFLVVILPASFSVRRRTLAVFAAIPAVALVAVVMTPGAFTASRDVTSGVGEGSRLRVVTANVLMSNGQWPALMEDVRAQAPDVIVFEELTRDLDEVLPSLAAAYPYRISTETPCVTLASRLPLSEARRLPIAGADRGRDLLMATVEVAGQPVTVVAVHFTPPSSAAAFETNRQQRDVFEDAIASVDGPLVVAGDFNATTFSPTFARLLLGTGLRIEGGTRQMESTYAVYGRLGLRIDHVLVRDLGWTSGEVFTLTGSDHRGVRVDLRLPQATGPSLAAAR